MGWDASQDYRDYRLKMSRKLSDAIAVICAQCPASRIPKAALNLSHPEKCACRCDRIAGPITSLYALLGENAPDDPVWHA